MTTLKTIFNKIDQGEELVPGELKFLLDLSDKDEVQALYDKAYEVKKNNVGTNAYFRGIVESTTAVI